MRQTQALEVMMSGNNVFLTGSPGAGKTYTIDQFIARARRAGKTVAVTASTGIAASHIGGNTIHSWAGIGIVDSLSQEDIKRLSESDKLLKRYNSTDVLVIDEISMLHGSRLDMINMLAKALRKSDEPFGGIQVILIGDLFQLPPVSRNTRVIDFAQNSQAWKELRLSVCYLYEQHRQVENDNLLLFLEAMRDDELNEDHFEIIKNRVNREPEESITVTRLYSHNIDVDEINNKHLALLPGKVRRYEMQSKGAKAKVTQLASSILAPEILQLKIDAEVMFVANNYAEGYVNGSRGRVIGFDGESPIVQLVNSKKITVKPQSWSLNEDGKLRAEISQLPIRLAWAITIHKSQGMSLDAAEIDLSKTFTPGMGYVALSRVRSLEGLYIKGINQMALRLNSDIYSYDKVLRQHSNQLAKVTLDIANETTIDVDESTRVLDEDLYTRLKMWRMSKSISEKIPPYFVAHNLTLETIASISKPMSERQLLAIPGISSAKLEKYGPDIIAILEDHFS